MALPRSTGQVLAYSAAFSVASSAALAARHFIDHGSLAGALTEGGWRLLLLFPPLFLVFFLVSWVRRSAERRGEGSEAGGAHQPDGAGNANAV